MTKQEAIELLSDMRSRYNCFDESERQFYEALSVAIKELSTQPERKGKWIEIQDEVFASTYRCSECGSEPLFDESEYALSNYCPNCGADMRGEEHATD